MQLKPLPTSRPRDEHLLVRVLPRLAAERRDPLAGEVCISITNPSQSGARVAGFAEVLRLGFHDTDRVGGGFTVMSPLHARQVLEFAARHAEAPFTVHCEAGASRSVAVGLFLAAWLRRPLELTHDVVAPNPFVLRRLRYTAVLMAARLRDARLLGVALKGPLAREHLYAMLPTDVADANYTRI